jgi:hypothetical protein
VSIEPTNLTGGAEHRPPIVDMIGARLVPSLFLVGVMLGLLGSVALGYVSTKKQLFEHFVRLHTLIGTQSFFNVTAREVMPVVEAVPPTKIMVVIGGSSVLNGHHQREAEIWTRYLQELLGDRFAVINLAIPAGRPGQLGIHAAEAILKAGRRVLFVADTNLTLTFSPIGFEPPYDHIYYDWKADGFLLPSVGRDEVVHKIEIDPSRNKGLQELKIGSSLNHLLYFNELWNFVGYRIVFLGGWSQFAIPFQFEPRVLKADLQESPPNGYYEYEDFPRMMEGVRAYTAPGLGDLPGKMVIAPVPPPLRNKSLAIMWEQSPYYVQHLSAVERARFEANYRRATESIDRAGLRAFWLGSFSWEISDYIDQVHLSEQGGRKLAGIVAPQLRQMALSLGYLQ